MKRCTSTDLTPRLRGSLCDDGRGAWRSVRLIRWMIRWMIRCLVRQSDSFVWFVQSMAGLGTPSHGKGPAMAAPTTPSTPFRRRCLGHSSKPKRQKTPRASCGSGMQWHRQRHSILLCWMGDWPCITRLPFQMDDCFHHGISVQRFHCVDARGVRAMRSGLGREGARHGAVR